MTRTNELDASGPRDEEQVAGGRIERVSGIYRRPTSEPPQRPLRVALLVRAGLVLEAAPNVELVAHDDPDPVNVRVFDASADIGVLAAAYRGAARVPAWTQAGLSVAPALYLCGPAPDELGDDVMRAGTSAAAALTAGSFRSILLVAAEQARVHAVADPMSQLHWARTSLGAWAEGQLDRSFTLRERTILGFVCSVCRGRAWPSCSC